jgi:hypothetical protein
MLFYCLLHAHVCTAGIIPSFYLDHSSKKATHILVATEGLNIDGVLEVLEPWKGDLRKGDRITVPELALFHSAEARTIHSWGTQDQGPRVVSGQR